MKRAVNIAKFLGFFIASFLLLNIFSVYYFNLPLSPVVLTGLATGTGEVTLYVAGESKNITIYSPTNTTYNFGVGDPLLLYLNTSANFFVDNWTYSLYDATNELDIENDTEFTPNQTISVVRDSNRLIVEAHETDADWITSDPVYFFVSVPNSAPILGNIDSPIYVCEGQKLDYDFNATDVDGDSLTPDWDPSGSFFAVFTNGQFNNTVKQFKISSGTLNGNFGDNPVNISVDDGEYADTDSTNITVIELNDAPSVTNPGARTIWTNSNNSDESSFNYQMVVTDEESGGSSSENLSFNLTWGASEDLFDINLTTGVMNYTPPVGFSGNSTHNLEACVNDTALSSPHANISDQCGEDGGVNVECVSFSLTITDDNRAPEIVSFSPINTTLSVSGTDSTNFGVIVSDADGTIPDIDWYVDGSLKEENVGKSIDNYTHSFGCGVGGTHNVSVIVSDGIASTTQVWNLSVSNVACPSSSSSGGGGGGGSLGGLCRELWVCSDWGVCQNVERSFDAGGISPEDYFNVKDLCLQNAFDDRFCGFQITTCRDLAGCNNTSPRVPKPVESQVCYFTENPSCSDGITNCHSGSCELLVDCGGPCGACPTCSDGIQNQGEANIDCGGPCPFACEIERPVGSISYLIIFLSLILLAVLIFIIYKVIKIFIYWKKEKRR